MVAARGGPLQRLDAHPLVAVAHEQLDRLAGLLGQPGEGGAGHQPPGRASAAAWPRPISRRPRAKRPGLVAADQAVGLQRHRERWAVARLSPVAATRSASGRGLGSRAARTANRLVQHAHTAPRRTPPQEEPTGDNGEQESPNPPR